MSLKPDISKHSDEEMKQLAAGRYELMKQKYYLDEAILGSMRMLATEIMVDVYPELQKNLKENDAAELKGEWVLYRQNVVESLVLLLIKRNQSGRSITED